MTGLNLAVKVSCPEMFDAFLAIAKRCGYQEESAGMHNTSPYIGFRYGEIRCSNGITDYSHQYLNVVNGSTQFDEIVQLLENNKVYSWKIGCQTITLHGGKLTCENTEIPFKVVKEIYEAMK